MSTFAAVFQQWTDFPKGLQVLVVDHDTQFLQDITDKLEGYQFLVRSFSSGEEACRALASYTQTFHVALVEASEKDDLDCFKILSFAKDVPTVMMSTVENMALMIKVIALGAVEFLVKPLSEDKLRNIWQHVIRKALDSSREALRPRYLQPGKPTTSTSTLINVEYQPCPIHKAGICPLDHEEKDQHSSGGICGPPRFLVACERLAAPSTPQLEQGGRTALQESTVDESPPSHDSTEVSNYKDSSTPPLTAAVALFARSANVKEGIRELPTISADTMTDVKDEKTTKCCTTPKLESILHGEAANLSQLAEEKVIKYLECSKDEELLENGLHRDVKTMMEACEMSSTDDYEPQEARSSTLSRSVISKDTTPYLNAESTCQSETPGSYQDKGESENEIAANYVKAVKDNKSAKKKMKVDWTADLHSRFVQAVEYLGVEQAIPSRILEVMKVDSLTRHNVASHLQKYRSHKKHLQARELEASKYQSKLNWGRPWNGAGPSANQMWIQPRPPLIRAPLHVWGHPKVDHGVSFPSVHYIAGGMAWPAFDAFSWKPPMADSWAPCLPSVAPCFLGGGSQPANFFATPGYAHREGSWISFLEDAETGNADAKTKTNNSDGQELDTQKQLLHEAIKEGLSNPWMPLPLGLKPPSIDSVLTELQRQGITTLSSSH